MKILKDDARVVFDTLRDVIKMIEVEHPGEFPCHLKSLYTSYYIMSGDSYITAVSKAERMVI